MTSTASHDTQDVFRNISQHIDEQQEHFLAIAKQIWANPELSFEEHQAAAALCVPLEEAGFKLERGVSGLDTAFRATWQGAQAGPTIAILCEYDALRGLGHACGHNLIGTGGMLAGWALRQAWPDMPGTLQVIGTPAEEGGGGKVIMVNDGVFADVDAAIMFHPSSGVSKAHRSGLAAQGITLSFHGKPSHAAAAPWKGVNALDAVVQFFVGIGLLRQQIEDGSRLHGIISHGGDAANIIPEYCEARMIVRADTMAYLETLKAKVFNVAQAAALATGCKLEVKEELPYANRVNNMVMARTFQKHLEALGDIVEEPSPNEGVGSSDIGNVSLVCPTIHPYVSISQEPVSGHTEGFREASNSDYGYSQMLRAAKAMALTAAELLADSSLLQRAKEEFQASSQTL